jgi:hydroxymethylpyrimidine pyrophosphatase-like HAD family hydrolase
MDKYLKPNSAYERLWAEYNKYGSLIVAVDFDDTLYDFHGTGDSYEMIKQLIRDLHYINCKIIIWSGNENIDDVTAYLEEQNIPWDLINENLLINGKWASGKDSRKVYANVYLDDRAGLEQVYNDLKKLVNGIRGK